VGKGNALTILRRGFNSGLLAKETTKSIIFTVALLIKHQSIRVLGCCYCVHASPLLGHYLKSSPLNLCKRSLATFAIEYVHHVPMGVKLFYLPELNPNIRVEMADSAKSVNTIG
jgi:hypothetical protein